MADRQALLARARRVRAIYDRRFDECLLIAAHLNRTGQGGEFSAGFRDLTRSQRLLDRLRERLLAAKGGDDA